jgi:hypothetical protein
LHASLVGKVPVEPVRQVVAGSGVNVDIVDPGGAFGSEDIAAAVTAWNLIGAVAQSACLHQLSP